MSDVELPDIQCDDDWLDLRRGDRGRVSGALHCALKPGSSSLIVTMPDWDLLLATIPEGYKGEPLQAGRRVTVVVTRNEDGVETDNDSITT